jgi:hypothetical protein
MAHYNRIVIERGKKKVFASALDWPGWSRSGKDDAGAIDNLIFYAERYRKVARLAGVEGIEELVASQRVVEHLEGTGATDFGVPDKIADVEHEWMTADECNRQVALLEACWSCFDDAAGRVSAELQKGPRGGGRDRDAIVEHTLEADRGYARHIGVKTAKGYMDTIGGLDDHRHAVVEALRTLNEENAETRWPLRYYIRRAAWHLLDHTWESEDKDLTGENNHADLKLEETNANPG